MPASSSARPNELVLEVDAPTDGWLVLTDRWARSWRASVDGGPAQVWGASFLWRALHVQAGRHEVRLVVRPLGYPALLLASWSPLVAVAIGSALAAVSRYGGARPAR